jgi:hypothetical protein
VSSETGARQGGRRDEWIDFGVMDMLRRIALDAYDRRLIGLELSDVAIDGCTTKGPTAVSEPVEVR